MDNWVAVVYKLVGEVSCVLAHTDQGGGWSVSA